MSSSSAKQVVVILLVVICASMLLEGHFACGLVNPTNPFQTILDKLGQSLSPPEEDEHLLVDRTAKTLKSLGVTSNTEPRTFSPGSFAQLPALATAAMPTLFRLGTGALANGYRVSLEQKDTSKYTIAALGNVQMTETTTRPGKMPQTTPLILYEMESCPSCRRVREALSMLYLTVTYRPCPKNGIHDAVDLKAAKKSIPVLVDPNTGVELTNVDDIIDYLFRTYGDGIVPWTLATDSQWVPLSATLGMSFRFGRGGRAKSSNPPTEPLVLWLYEGSPWCKLVREVLSELELVHTQISCPRGSTHRQLLFEQTGRFQVPYLEDPNTGVTLFESEAIIEYVQKQYGVEPSPVKYM